MVFPVKSRKIEEMTRGDKGKLLILFVPLFTLSLLSKIVCSLWMNQTLVFKNVKNPRTRLVYVTTRGINDLRNTKQGTVKSWPMFTGDPFSKLSGS